MGIADAGVLLCLVVGRGAYPDAAVSAAGGTVLLHVPDGRRVLASATFATLTALQRHPDVALAGPVSIDPERFGRFAELVGLDDADEDEG